MVSHFATRFDVVDAPEQFDRLLLIIDFPGGAWTPPHAPGGALYASSLARRLGLEAVYVAPAVVEGEVPSRLAGPSGGTSPAAGDVPAASWTAADDRPVNAAGRARFGASAEPPPGQ
jgi:hypothetical protein